jgi:hypothetical protein
VRGGYDNALQTTGNEVCSGSVKGTGLGFTSAVIEFDGCNEIARKRQHEVWSSNPYCNGAEKYSAVRLLLGCQRPLSSSSLHTLADCESAQPCRNGVRQCSSPRTLTESLALGGVRHESVYEKKMREIRVVRARLRRMNRPSGAEDTNATYSTYDENPSQPPPLSQPLLGSLKPTSPVEVFSSRL